MESTYGGASGNFQHTVFEAAVGHLGKNSHPILKDVSLELKESSNSTHFLLSEKLNCSWRRGGRKTSIHNWLNDVGQVISTI